MFQTKFLKDPNKYFQYGNDQETNKENDIPFPCGIVIVDISQVHESEDVQSYSHYDL